MNYRSIATMQNDNKVIFVDVIFEYSNDVVISYKTMENRVQLYNCWMDGDIEGAERCFYNIYPDLVDFKTIDPHFIKELLKDKKYNEMREDLTLLQYLIIVRNAHFFAFPKLLVTKSLLVKGLQTRKIMQVHLTFRINEKEFEITDFAYAEIHQPKARRYMAYLPDKKRYKSFISWTQYDIMFRRAMFLKNGW